MSPTPKVSVIVPVYRAEPYFGKCLRSLFEQTLDEVEYIFIDDCSPDGSIPLLEKTAETLSPQRRSQVRIIRQPENRGVAAARSAGMEAATGEYVIHCDADDWVDTDAYETMYALAKEKQADIVCCDFVCEFAHRQQTVKYDYTEETPAILRASVPSTLNSSLWNKLIRRELYTAHTIRPFEGINMNEDLGLTLRLRYLSRKTLVIPRAFYHYNRQNESSMIAIPKRSYVEERIECARLLDKWFAAQTDGSQYTALLDAVKFLSKAGFFAYAQIRDIARWKQTYPETNRAVWRYRTIPGYTRTAMWLTLHGCRHLGTGMIDLKPQLRKVKNFAYRFLHKIR